MACKDISTADPTYPFFLKQVTSGMILCSFCYSRRYPNWFADSTLLLVYTLLNTPSITISWSDQKMHLCLSRCLSPPFLQQCCSFVNLFLFSPTNPIPTLEICLLTTMRGAVGMRVVYSPPPVVCSPPPPVVCRLKTVFIW